MLNKLLRCFRKQDDVKDIVLNTDDYYQKAKSGYDSIIKNQEILIETIHMLIETLDTQDIIAAWRKDENDRYIFANKILRKDLFNNAALTKILGKTDNELTLGKKIVCDISRQIAIMKPQDLPDISNYLGGEVRICNITDIITRAFRKPCFYIEDLSDDLCLAVKKYPIINDNNETSGTIGYYINIAHDKEYVYKYIREAVKNKKAFQIDNTDSFYIEEPVDINIEARCFLKHTIEGVSNETTKNH